MLKHELGHPGEIIRNIGSSRSIRCRDPLWSLVRRMWGDVENEMKCVSRNVLRRERSSLTHVRAVRNNGARDAEEEAVVSDTRYDTHDMQWYATRRLHVSGVYIYI